MQFSLSTLDHIGETQKGIKEIIPPPLNDVQMKEKWLQNNKKVKIPLYLGKLKKINKHKLA